MVLTFLICAILFASTQVFGTADFRAVDLSNSGLASASNIFPLDKESDSKKPFELTAAAAQVELSKKTAAPRKNTDADSKKGKDMEAAKDPSRTDWPELVGWDVDKAVSWLQEARPTFSVQAVKSGSMVTMDYREDRVRVYYDEDTKKVSRAPRIG